MGVSFLERPCMHLMLRTLCEFVTLCYSETETALHVAQSPVSSLRVAVIQPV